MAIDPIELERPIIYDIEELCKDECDISCIRAKMAAQVKRMMTAESHQAVANKAQVGVGEIVKDVWAHGSESEPMVVFLSPEMGGVALHSFSIEDPSKTRTDKWGEDPHHNGMGETILEGFFGDDYACIRDGDVHERHLFIRGDVDVIEFPRIPHDSGGNQSNSN